MEPRRLWRFLPIIAPRVSRESKQARPCNNDSGETDGNFRPRSFSYRVLEARCPAFYINKIAQRKETADRLPSWQRIYTSIDVTPEFLQINRLPSHD